MSEPPTHAEIRKARLAQLTELFPKDERLCNAILFSLGCCEQIPILNDALMKQLLDLPAADVSTISWESMTTLAVVDVLRWAAQLELALHDLRQALFFRYNTRVTKINVTEEQLRKSEAAIAEEIAANQPPTPQPEQKSEEERKDRAIKNIGTLFGNLGKKT